MPPYFFPLYSVAVWGGNFTLMKVLASNLPPHAMNGMRTLIAGVIFAVLWRLRERLSLRQWVLLALLGVLGNSGYQFFFLEGVPRLPAAYNAIVNSTGPVWVALVSLLWLRERLSAMGYFGLGLSVLGVMGLARGGGGSVQLLGIVLAQLAVLVWAIYSVAARPVGNRYHLITWTGGGFVLGMIPYWIFSLPQAACLELSQVPPLVWLGIGASAVLANVTAFLAWTRAIQLLGPVRASVFQNLTPLVGVLVAALTLHERLGGLELLAGTLTLLGVLITQRARISPIS